MRLADTLLSWHRCQVLVEGDESQISDEELINRLSLESDLSPNPPRHQDESPQAVKVAFTRNRYL
uniref:Uncharacterized protein n=1 Tax=Melanopsichium pennsylvanicum 4 TaxID=1398559 RepID=A0A077R7S6_9BASI|nr:uncharacterized protein BN887_06320 [Melanopsichium pennsylvanicum 4]